ncbi:hypothetical protein MN116_001934 [Schistosoma mekongi]|uniref:Uncharacterized protein n=1 Tax=Schistosoma mekongi TaxID=38744 RepID=A0AAE1ZKA5_SCHME|nr:hypothetical protein MN116_001934 [Schistosoma mekongi]
MSGHQTNPTPISSTNVYLQNSTGTSDTQRQRNLASHLSTELNTSSPGITFGNGKSSDQRNPLLFPSPTGTLDLSHYNFVPIQTPNTTSSNKDTKSRRQNGGISNQVTTTNNRLNDALIDNNVNNNNADLIDSAQTVIIGEKEKKRRRFRRPRKNSKLDRLIRFLEDKRVKDDGNGEELEDLQMPRLRKVLNIIFVTLGVCFLLAVIIVILYTTFAGETDSFKDLCHHRNKVSSSCDNQTDLDHLELEDDDSTVSGIPLTHIKLSNSPTPEVTQKFPPMLMSTSEGEIPYPTLSQKHYDTPVLQSPLDVSISQIDGTNDGVTRGPLPPPPPDIYSYIDKLDDIYLTHTNNQGNYPWSHKVYNNAPIKESINNHIQQSSNGKQQNDENSIWSNSWMQPVQHKANNYKTQLSKLKKYIKKM